MVARAQFALGGYLGGFEARVADMRALRETNPAAYRESAETLMREVADSLDARQLAEYTAMADTTDALLAIDFGAEEDADEWRALTPDMAYDAEVGYGWLPLADASQPTPEETGYAQAHRQLAGVDKIWSHGFPFWPFAQWPPAQTIRRALFSGQQRTLRVDLPDGSYRVNVVTGNPAWGMRIYRCSGMVSEGGGVKIFDAPFYPGEARDASFTTTVTGGRMDLTFGGPSGWGVSAVIVRAIDADPGDALAAAALRDWRISPRYPNPEWWPIQQVRFSPDEALASPNAAAWTAVAADTGGVVHLGDNTQAETGDVVYATTTLQADEAGEVWLNVASTSSAEVYVNGDKVAYLPNVKGLQRDECTFQVPVRAGPNTIVVKLQRYWERHWMFYASQGVG